MTLNALQELAKLIQQEIPRIQTELKLDTLQGRRDAIALYESLYNVKYVHGVDVEYSIAKMRVLRRSAAAA